MLLQQIRVSCEQKCKTTTDWKNINLHCENGGWSRMGRLPLALQTERAVDLTKQVGLKHKTNSKAHTCSLSNQKRNQRVSIIFISYPKSEEDELTIEASLTEGTRCPCFSTMTEDIHSISMGKVPRKVLGWPLKTPLFAAVPRYYYYSLRLVRFSCFLIGIWKEVLTHQRIWHLDIVCKSYEGTRFGFRNSFFCILRYIIDLRDVNKVKMVVVYGHWCIQGCPP